jgi:hypothetical protein
MENLLLLLTPKNDPLNSICNELDCLILIINQLISSINRDKLFSNMIKDHSIQSSPIVFGIDDQTRRVISSSISYSSTPSTITMKRSKVSTSFFHLEDYDHNSFLSYVYFVKNRLMIMMMFCMN